MGMARWPVYSPLLARDHDSSWFIMIHHDSSFSTFRLLLQIERDWNHDLIPTAQERRFSHCIWRTLIIRRNSPWKTCSYQTHWPGTRTNFKHEACASRSSSVFVPILTNLNIADPWANLERSSEIRDSPPFHPWTCHGFVGYGTTLSSHCLIRFIFFPVRWPLRI